MSESTNIVKDTLLLPCPFCGWEHPHVISDGNGCAWVSCGICFARSGGVEEAKMAERICQEEAVKEWNHRSPALNPADAHTPLWAIYIQGPDDMVPVASYLDACRAANAFNAWWQSYMTKNPLGEYGPRLWAAPVEWTGDAERHAFWVKNPSPDYAAFVAFAPQEKMEG